MDFLLLLKKCEQSKNPLSKQVLQMAMNDFVYFSNTNLDLLG